MAGLNRFDLRTVAPTPWKNGGGSTQEVACFPIGAGSDTFAWRVSVATIARNGPFSAFPGVDRTITLLRGAGVTLRSSDARLHADADVDVDHRLDEPLKPFSFSGDTMIDCTMLGGESSDFNVMVRRGVVTASTDVIRSALEAPATMHGLLMAVTGSWSVTLAPYVAGETMAPQQGVWWAGSAIGPSIRPLSSDAAMLFVSFAEEHR